MQNSEKPTRYSKPAALLTALAVGIVLAFQAPVQAHDLKGFRQFKEPSPKLHSALGKAEALAQEQRFLQARKVLDAYAASQPSETHPLLYYELGYFAYKSGDMEYAIANLKKTVAIAPKLKDGWQLLSLAWQESGSQYAKENKQEKPKRIRSMQESAVAMDRAAGLSGDDDLLYQSAMLWLEAEKAKKALTILEGLTQKDAPKEEWLVGLSEALKALKNKEATAEAMEKAARVQNNPELLFHAAWLWNELEKPGRALPLLEPLAQKKRPDKNWLLLLVSVYNTLEQYADAAMTFERVIEVDPAPDYLYNCGVLWLQADKPDKALNSLLRLADATPPKADWFVATAQAWLIKEQIPKAADAMERAASIGKKPQHIHQAGVLRIQLKQADRAIALLTPLAGLPKPKSEWLVALSNAWLMKENYLKGATYMERAAVISGKGKRFHRAAMLWRVEGNIPKTITLLRKSVSGKKVEQLWLVDLASVLIDADREDEVRPVMKRTNLADQTVSNQLRYRGVVIWLNLQEPQKAYPLLKTLAGQTRPDYAWLNAMVKTCVELDRMKEAANVLTKTLDLYPDRVNSWKLAVWLALQQGNYIDAVAAKEIVRQFEPQEEKHHKDLIRLYLLAGVPERSARFYRHAMGSEPTAEQLDRLIDIYLSGRMYEQALQPALEASGKNKTPEHMESLGDIYYALHRYKESCAAYERAVTLSGDPNPDVRMKAAYAAMKSKQYSRAVDNFKVVVSSGAGEESQIRSAIQNLAYIEKLKERGNGCD